MGNERQEEAWNTKKAKALDVMKKEENMYCLSNKTTIGKHPNMTK